jgi:phage shock protein E
MSLNILADEKLIIDVRTIPEWKKNRIENTLLIEWQDLLTVVNKMGIKKNREILLFCRSGNRSGKAKKILEENGYTNVKNLGSIQDAGNYLKLPVVNNNQ